MTEPQQVSELLEWRTYATVASAAIALTALLRPEIAKLFAKWRGKIAIYPVGEVCEVGFGGAGATIGLELVLRSLARDFFLSEIQLVCRRVEDGMVRTFTWGVFRPPLAPFLPQQPTGVETPAGFYLEPKAPRRLGVVFFDRASRSDVLNAIEPLRRKWFEEFTSIQQQFVGVAGGEGEGPKKAIEQALRAFLATDEALTAFGHVQRAFFWRPGGYELAVVAIGEEPRREFRRTLRFLLEQSESDALYRNPTVILRQSAGFSDIPLYFARAPLTPISAEGKRAANERGH